MQIFLNECVGKSNIICGFLTAWGSVPLTPCIVQGSAVVPHLLYLQPKGLWLQLKIQTNPHKVPPMASIYM